VCIGVCVCGDGDGVGAYDVDVGVVGGCFVVVTGDDGGGDVGIAIVGDGGCVADRNGNDAVNVVVYMYDCVCVVCGVCIDGVGVCVVLMSTVFVVWQVAWVLVLRMGVGAFCCDGVDVDGVGVCIGTAVCCR